jgi:hypothetical protein
VNQPERRLEDVLGFAEDDRAFAELVYPWPESGDTLLRDPVGDETWIYALQEWVPNDLERLTYFALQYHHVAREVVRDWLRGHDNPETRIFAIAFLYRHAIELKLKALIASDPAFRKRSAKSQAKALTGHNLEKLWNRLTNYLQEYEFDTAEMKHVRRIILELTALDKSSDGFRYPFRYEGNAHRVTLLPGLANKSADNFVWVLEAAVNWLDTVEEQRDQYMEYQAELA